MLTVRSVPTVALLLMSALGASFLTACSDLYRMSSEEALLQNTPSKTHPIAFVDRDEALEIEVPPHNHGLSRNQYIDVYRFAVRYRTESLGRISIVGPGSGHPAFQDVRRALTAAGIDPSRVTGKGRGRRHAIVLSYQRPLAVAPECGDWSRDVGVERERVNYPDFGCSTQRNFANMIANSRDLLASQEETPASGERRTRIWSKYVGGESSGPVQAAPTDAGADTKPKAGAKK